VADTIEIPLVRENDFGGESVPMEPTKRFERLVDSATKEQQEVSQLINNS
jgi:hypothetical protein